ncbi:hypothetical protein [Haloferula sp. BvORR071]|uniref:hypothetical protein n=1 Tax=Haloferula sp. BvORR071 TaxID=1396141 RepID=UPI002240F79C|nr:hypothetical protein [Haloferula sp. BvORR071]
MDQGLAAQAVQDQNAAAEGKVVFTIPADDVGGNAAIASFRDEMSAQFGAEAAEKLLKGLHHRAYFGSFGRANIRIELSEAPGSGNGIQTMIIYKTTDPETGDLVNGGGGPLKEQESFSKAMGKATYDRILAAQAAISVSK